MAEQSGERTEDPTEQRKKQARKKGTVVKSNDLIGAVVFIVILMTMPTVMDQAGKGLLQSVRGSFGNLPTDASPASMYKAWIAGAGPMLPAICMLIAVAMVSGVAMNFAQVGFHISGEALNPSFAKLNPINGIKRMFSMNGAFEAAKSTGKLVIFGWIAWSALQGQWAAIGNAWQLTPVGLLILIGEVAKSILTKIAIAWLAMAALDYFFQKYQVNKQLKMTKYEVRREFMDNETSAEIKQAMERNRRKLSKQRTAQAVKTADVIITNPTHFAIAIKYEPGQQHAPQVVAKGVDLLALKIRELAKEAKVPIVENKPLARALYKECEVGDFVPRELFQPVAEVLAYVYRTLKQVRPKS